MVVGAVVDACFPEPSTPSAEVPEHPLATAASTANAPRTLRRPPNDIWSSLPHEDGNSREAVAASNRRPPGTLTPVSVVPPAVLVPPPFSRRLFAVALVLATLFALAIGYKQEVPEILSPLAAVAVVAMFGLWFGSSFWPALVGLFMLRTSMDAFKVTSGTNGLDPGSAIGAIFVLAAVLWLLAQRRAGRLRPVSGVVTAICVFAAAAVLSAPGSRMLSVSLPSALKVVSIALMAIVLDQVFRQSPDRIRTMVTAMVVSLLVPTVSSFGQLMKGLPYENVYSGYGRARGTFTHPNPLATYLVSMCLLCAALLPHVFARARATKRRGELLVLLVALGAALATLYLTYSRGAWIALVIGVAAVGLLQNRNVLYGMVAVIMVMLIAVPSTLDRFSDLTKANEVSIGQGDPNSLAWRVRYWGEILPYWQRSPLTGIGPEMVRNTQPTGFDPHNSFLQALIEMGVVGLGAFLAVLVTIAVSLRRALKRNRAPGLDRALCVAAAAMCTAVLVQLPTENILVSAINWWYVLPIVIWASLGTTAVFAPDLPDVEAQNGDESADGKVANAAVAR